jgi:hypothetical protein
MRLSLLARFDAGVIGDITNWAPFVLPDIADRTYVHRTGVDTPILEWQSSNANRVFVQRVTGELHTDDDAGSESIDERGCAPRTRSESPPSPAKAVGHAGRDQPGRPHGDGPAAVDVPARFAVNEPGPQHSVPAGGVRGGDKDRFTVLVEQLVTLLSNRSQTSPFNKLAGGLNYFMAWVPSPDAGVWVLNELVSSSGTRATDAVR